MQLQEKHPITLLNMLEVGDSTVLSAMLKERAGGGTATALAFIKGVADGIRNALLNSIQSF